jgi:hypothetical protein
MTFTRNREILRRRLFIAIGVMMAILFTLIFLSGGTLFGTMSVKDFSLCEAGLRDGKPQPLNSLVLTPTNVVYGCGYMEVEPFVSTVQCLRFYLNRSTEIIAEPASEFCLPSRSQYFLYPFESTLLRNPGKYRLHVYAPSSRVWTESIAFEIRSTGK